MYMLMYIHYMTWLQLPWAKLAKLSKLIFVSLKLSHLRTSLELLRVPGNVDSKARGGRNRCISLGQLGRIGSQLHFFAPNKPQRRCFQWKSPSTPPTKCFLRILWPCLGSRICSTCHCCPKTLMFMLNLISKTSIYRNFEVHPLQDCKSMSLVILFRIFLLRHEGWKAELHLFGRTWRHDSSGSRESTVWRGIQVQMLQWKVMRDFSKTQLPGDEIV